MPAVRPEAQHQHRRRAAPVTGETHHADQADQQRLQPRAPDALRILHAEHHQPPRQRPDHARLAVEGPGVQKRDVAVPDRLPDPAVVKRHERPPVAEPVPFRDIREMRDQREKEHAEHVFVHVPRVEEPLRDEEAHRRHRDAPDDVHQLRLPVQRTPGVDRPRDVVDRHGDDRDQLDRVRIQYLVAFHARPVRLDRIDSAGCLRRLARIRRVEFRFHRLLRQLHRQLLRQLHRQVDHFASIVTLRDCLGALKIPAFILAGSLSKTELSRT